MIPDQFRNDEEFHDGFVGISRAELQAMPDSELAHWQSQCKPGDAKHTLAEREWQRRMISHQLAEQFQLDSKLAAAGERAMRFAAILGVVGTLAGAAIGAFATFKAGSLQGAQPAPPQVPRPAAETAIALPASAAAPARAASK